MITRGEDVEASALRQRGWPIAAIARHLGRDRKTVRAHLRGDREAGVRQRAKSDRLGPFVAYLQARFNDNAHIWGTALYDEVVQLGCPGSYPSFARQLRRAELRPNSEACAGVKGREYIEIAHPPGEEIQWDWFHRRAPWAGMANILLGTLSFSGKVGEGRAGGAPGPGPLDRGDGCGAAPFVGHCPGVANGPAVDRDRARNPRCAGQLRPSGQAL
jgi:hypothetical protein